MGRISRQKRSAMKASEAARAKRKKKMSVGDDESAISGTSSSSRKLGFTGTTSAPEVTSVTRNFSEGYRSVKFALHDVVVVYCTKVNYFM